MLWGGLPTPAYGACVTLDPFVRWRSEPAFVIESGDRSTVKTAQQAQANWSGAATRATPNFVAGVQATQKDQAALAVAQQATLLQNFTAAVQSGRWAAGVTRRGTAYWKQQTEAKQNNYNQGYQAGSNNYAAAAAKF